MDTQVKRYEVIVGNVGTVHDSVYQRDAEQVYVDYVARSQNGLGRAAWESVILMVDGEIVQEHTGTVDGQ